MSPTTSPSPDPKETERKLDNLLYAASTTTAPTPPAQMSDRVAYKRAIALGPVVFSIHLCIIIIKNLIGRCCTNIIALDLDLIAYLNICRRTRVTDGGRWALSLCARAARTEAMYVAKGA